ncbi:MAG TPA: adenylate/guanylate cyclase domain-containing protein [Patescibacteria group bacterium]|nr:adenylate/guanylate cyclase domain-containing protein [Patescibacteria group bacterium]
MPRCTRLEKSAYVLLILLAAVFVGAVTRDAWRMIGRPWTGFPVMENLVVGVGGRQRTAAEPFDLVRAVNGHLVSSCRELQKEVERYPAGTKLRYLLVRGGSLVEEEIASREMTLRTFKHFVVDNLLPGILVLGLGALVALLRPGVATTRLFLAFCLTAVVVNVGSWDLAGTHRFTELFFFAWTFWPALFAHLALVFPERTAVARRWPRVVWVPYAMSAALWLWLQAPMSRDSWAATAGLIAIYWTVALVELLVGLGSTARTGSTPLVRQRARVLLAGFGIGYLVPVIGTTLEVVLHAQIPFLADVWRLAFVFPLAVAYAIVRYQLFDIRAVVRAGTVYSVVTAMVALGYAGLLAALNVLFARLDLAMSGVVAPLLVAFVVVLFVNRVYARTQALLDRLFFRARYDAGQALARLADAMTTTLELDRLAALIGGTVDGILHPERVTLLLADDERGAFRRVGGGDGLAAHAVLATCLAGRREPLSRETLLADPELEDFRQACLADLDALDADVAVPVVFRERLTALLMLGPRRRDLPYTSADLRILKIVATQSAVALEHARAYHALQAALRRVQILESIRAGLSKFVPRTVQRLIEQAPDAPELAKRETDVSVLFVDIAGYTRLAGRLDAATVERLIERYFGAFLDEILKNGGDVNETAGDGLMVIFQDADPRRHARSAVTTALALLRRAREINAAEPLDEPVALHVGVNSGRVAVGATKIEGTAGTRWTYTASGPVTNVAARLAALGDDAIHLGEATTARLPSRVGLEDLGEVPLRNVEEPVRVFRLAPPAAVPVGV